MKPLDRLFAPRSVAVVAGRYAAPALEQLDRMGFDGAVHVVSPSRPEIGGRETVPTVADLPVGIDAAFVAVPAEACPAVVATLRHHDCGGVVCFSSEFAESGNPALQADLIVAVGDMPLLGPNCHGLISGLDRVVLWPDAHGVRPIERGVAILSQSGNIAINMTMQQRSVPIGLVASLGNQAQLEATQILRHLLQDQRITAIGLYLEGIADAVAFADAALAAAAAGKPIVALKAGRSNAGARATITHTSTLAGSGRIYDALFERVGIAQVGNVSSFLETLKLLHVHGRLRGRRIGSASCSGGEAALVADLAEFEHLEMPPLSEDCAHAVAISLDGRVHAANPLDYHTFIWGNAGRLESTYFAFMADKFDLAVLVLDYPTGEGQDVSSWDITLRAWVQAAHRSGCPAAVLSCLPECLPATRRDELMAAGIVPLQGMNDALAAVAAAAAASSNGDALSSFPPPAQGFARQFGEYEAKSMLAKHGLPVPRGVVVDIADAGAAGALLGYPIAVKTANPAIAHKSDVGGVALALRDRDQVQAAADKMREIGRQVLVERMVQPSIAELIVGVTQEPGFGHVMVIGAGGVLAELIDDSVVLLFPLNRAMIERAMDRLRISRLLYGHRGRAAGDRCALVDAILAIETFVVTHVERLVELDVNPLMVLPEGQGVLAADALLRMIE